MSALSASSGNAQLKLDHNRQKARADYRANRDLDEETRLRQCTESEPHRGTSQAMQHAVNRCQVGQYRCAEI